MKIEEAMVYLLATSQHGMKTEQLARELELRGLVQSVPESRWTERSLRRLSLSTLKYSASMKGEFGF